jgi:hypothetical protein
MLRPTIYMPSELMRLLKARPAGAEQHPSDPGQPAHPAEEPGGRRQPAGVTSRARMAPQSASAGAGSR